MFIVSIQDKAFKFNVLYKKKIRRSLREKFPLNKLNRKVQKLILLGNSKI
jgi:hypothetical protein